MRSLVHTPLLVYSLEGRTTVHSFAKRSEVTPLKRGYKWAHHCRERRQSSKPLHFTFLDKEDVPGDGGDVVAPEEAAGAEEAAVELLHEDGALCRAEDVAGNARLPHESDPRIRRLGLNLQSCGSE